MKAAYQRIVSTLRNKISLDRNEFSGAFGDIGTVLPLIVGLIMASGINGSRVFIMFGIMQIMTAITYGIPIPVQPLKVTAMIVITQHIDGNVLFGGGLAIGITMLVLSLSGVIELIAKIIPKSVVRGIQIGLGLQLVFLALTQYIPSPLVGGNIFAALSMMIMAPLIGNRKLPPSIAMIVLGAVCFFLTGYYHETGSATEHIASIWPDMPSLGDTVSGFLIFAIPQIPLSLGNSIYATTQLAKDCFPDVSISPKKISITYSLMNIINPVFGGIPVCHGSGGMAGHYLFGARTGGSVFICGLLFILIGAVFHGDFGYIFYLLPIPMLGVILLFEGISLVLLVKDISSDVNTVSIALIVSAFAVTLPYGYLAGMIAGILAHHVMKVFPNKIPHKSGDTSFKSIQAG